MARGAGVAPVEDAIEVGIREDCARDRVDSAGQAVTAERLEVRAWAQVDRATGIAGERIDIPKLAPGAGSAAQPADVVPAQALHVVHSELAHRSGGRAGELVDSDQRVVAAGIGHTPQ